MSYVTSTSCRLIVIAAGAPRCGSTVQHEWIREALTVLGLSPVVLPYWNWHIHAKIKDDGKANLTIKHLKGTEIVITKTHEFDPRLFHMCQEQLVFTTHRNPLNMVRSAMSLGWVNNPYKYVKEVVRIQQQWAQFAFEDTSYEEIKNTPKIVYRRYVIALANKFSVSVPHMLNYTGLSRERNRALPHHPFRKLYIDQEQLWDAAKEWLPKRSIGTY